MSARAGPTVNLIFKVKNAAAGIPSLQKLENKGKILDLSFFSPIIFDHKFALKNQIFNGPRTPSLGHLDAWDGRSANLILKVKSAANASAASINQGLK